MEKERQAYIDYLEKKHNRKIKTLDINIDGEYAELHYTFEPVGFERIEGLRDILSARWRAGTTPKERRKKTG